MIAAYNFYFAQPWWLVACLLAVPVVWMGARSLSSLGMARRVAAIALRVLVIALLAALLARPMLGRKNEQLTLLAVIDRSQSVPPHTQDAGIAYLLKALEAKPPKDQLAVVDVAEAASIARLPGTDLTIEHRSPSLSGEQSYLSGGLQMAMAIAPPDAACRLLLVSDGNETSGDLREVARLAAANRIPIDVLPLRYRYEHEVVFSRLSCPPRARSGQTVPIRFVFNSTGYARGKLLLSLNGQTIHLDPSSAEMAVPIELEKGVNVKTAEVEVGARGMHEFEATFIPDSPQYDRLTANNRASAMTYVAGPGYILLADADGTSGKALAAALTEAHFNVRYRNLGAFPQRLADLMDTDCLVLVDADNSAFSLQQQEMICRYVSDMGGGLVMTGGPNALGAGGWIGSPVAQILPVDLDPPQKQQMPKGALVLIMHACEMPNGNMWGKKIALAAVGALSRLDLVGVMSYQWDPQKGQWVYPLALVGDRSGVTAAINGMEMGDMPDLGAPIQGAYTALQKAAAGQKHIIVITDADPASPSPALLAQLRKAGITCTGVAVYPHNPNDVKSLDAVARATGGRFYNVQDASTLPQIFVKEAQVVRRSLIVEESFTPTVSFSLSELIKGLGGTPQLDGYVLTGARGGLNQVVLTSKQGDPVLATGQCGLGRCVVFTSSADDRWASPWLSWGGYNRFWEQAVRWSARSGSSSDCEIFAEVQDRQVDVTVETTDASGGFLQLANIAGQVIAPDMATKEMPLQQVGPGRYHGRFQAGPSGSYLINLQYSKAGSDAKKLVQSVVTVPYAPEFNDLTDNSALLAEIAEMTGGRVLGGDPTKTDLFDRHNIVHPQTALPLTKLLGLLWLGLFVLDVAVRRVALDWRAVGRRTKALWSGRKAGKGDATLDRLKDRRQQVRRELGDRAKELSSRKYDAGEGPPGELPTAPMAAPPPDRKEPQAKPPAPPPAEDSSHVGRLLKAKKDADDKMRGKK